MVTSEIRAQRFLKNIERTFQTTGTYHPASHQSPIYEVTSGIYTHDRTRSIRGLLYAKKTEEVKNDSSKAYLSEWATVRALAAPLQAQGYLVEMAPETIEDGDAARKGIDLLVAKRGEFHQIIPFLGINVKLKQFKPSQRTERHYFDPALCAPAIHLSLGDWQIKTRELEEARIRDWLTKLAVPAISGSGKIPYIDSLRRYIFSRIENTLAVYRWRVDAITSGERKLPPQERALYPDEQETFTTFYHKLTQTQALFAEVGTGEKGSL